MKRNLFLFYFSACVDDCYIAVPLENYYLRVGDMLLVTVETKFDSSFYVYTKDSIVITSKNKDSICNPDYCVFHLNGHVPRLEIVHFNFSVVGSYEILILSETAHCKFHFNITQAGVCYV